ncbi:MAG: hypothetical protein EBZ89_05875 [Chloroflexi bacterium]|nr:hypothetical protein [Chloroflexota bacterium]
MCGDNFIWSKFYNANAILEISDVGAAAGGFGAAVGAAGAGDAVSPPQAINMPGMSVAVARASHARRVCPPFPISISSGHRAEGVARGWVSIDCGFESVKYAFKF